LEICESSNRHGMMTHMGDANATVTLEQFLALTVSPGQAIDLLGSAGWNVFVAKRELTKRLETGLVEAYAETVVISSAYGQSETREFPGLSPNFWKEADLSYDADFWLTGQIDSGVNIAFGVRFKPESIRRIIPLQQTATIAESPQDSTQTINEIAKAKPVSAADLEKWAKVFLTVHGDNPTEALALRSAKAMFPDSAISRDRVRALLPPRKPGRPASRGKSGE
jgi:hypothetical protein